MKKRNFTNRLVFKKKVIAALDAFHLKGGTVGANDSTTVDNSLGKKSTCPIETCTCTDAVVANCDPEPVRTNY